MSVSLTWTCDEDDCTETTTVDAGLYGGSLIDGYAYPGGLWGSHDDMVLCPAHERAWMEGEQARIRNLMQDRVWDSGSQASGIAHRWARAAFTLHHYGGYTTLHPDAVLLREKILAFWEPLDYTGDEDEIIRVAIIEAMRELASSLEQEDTDEAHRVGSETTLISRVLGVPRQ